MKDKRLVTFIYESQSQNYLVFYLVSLSLYPNSVLNPLSQVSGLLSYKIYFLVLQLAQVVRLALFVFVAERDDAKDGLAL